MPRTKGSLNKKGKQSVQERILKRRAANLNREHSVESRQKENDKKKVDRREKRIAMLNERIKKQHQELYSVGRFSGTTDPALK